jgi:hypothetical protein
MPSLCVLLLVTACVVREPTNNTPVVPYDVGGGWKSCPVGFWIRAGRCVPWHEGQDVEVVDEDPQPYRRSGTD